VTEPTNGSNADATTSEGIDTQAIEAFLGYSARRASLRLQPRRWRSKARTRCTR
jgi:hypothetical protein